MTKIRRLKMAYKWTILKAAVEQEILFPSIRNYEEYKKK